MHCIIQLLSHPACEIIEQIEFQAEYIEVSQGWLFHKISTRSFVQDQSALPHGKMSPRTYIRYDSSTPPQHFILKMLLKIPFRIQKSASSSWTCLARRRMPLKVRKLVVSGPMNSSKTSWACLHRIIASDRIASITREKQFSAAMIDEWPTVDRSLKTNHGVPNNHEQFHFDSDRV